MKIEYDSQDETYRIVVAVMDAGHRCGYVSVPVGHPWHSKDESTELEGVDLNTVTVNPTDPIGTLLCACMQKVTISYLSGVHGGVTYSRCSPNYPIPGTKDWWFGFDCAHADDNPEIGGQPFDYVLKECLKLKAFLQQYEHPTQTL